ncbi:HAD-IIB family hydrolase [Lactiplantibacillus daoliensis]|uniref:HAD-IIB family hydrolase n=1 Tax=Lactiplantibacillus daoliensis TaxID=2559916 RepID=A0ABW1UGH8_9LACO|nr:HAD-IIB family hydrolase [Lactiplantibacillus daoliensis]
MVAYQVLCSDLDGTLLNQNKQVSSMDQVAIQRWQAQGKLFGITSGRALSGLAVVTAMLQSPPDFIVALNGAYVQTIDHQIVQQELPTAISYEILLRLQAQHYDFLTVTINGDSWRVVSVVRQNHELTFSTLFTKLAEGQLIDKISIKTLKASDDEQFKLLLSDLTVEVTISDVCYVEVTRQGVTKLSGLKIALNDPKTLDNVVAVGDYLNDLAMIKGVGRGYAVANALPELQKAATSVTVDHDHQPLQAIIDELLN